MKIKSKKTLLLSSVIALALIAAGVYAYSKNSNNTSTETPPVTTKDKINYSPPTDEEKKAGDSVKEKLGDSENSEPEQEGNAAEQKKVEPYITTHGVYSGNVEVSAGVSGVLEKSGKCTLTLKKGSKTVSQSKTAVPNVSEMSCGLIKIPTSKLSSGVWSATVSYSSAKAKGTSDAVPIEVK